MDQAAVLEDIRSEGYARMSIAKSVAGLFSEVGGGGDHGGAVSIVFRLNENNDRLIRFECSQ